MPIVLECVHPNKFYAACTSDLWNSVNMGKSFLPISSRYWELVKHESGPIYEQLKKYTEFSKRFGLVTFVPI